MKRNHPNIKVRPITDIKVDNALYRLLLNFLASPSIAKLISDEGYDEWVFSSMIDEHEENEIVECLLYSATALRAADDLKQVRKHYMQQNVGHFLGRQKGPLSLREACNKIIHAQTLKYDTDIYKYVEYLNPTIFLTGTRNRKKWRVNIEIKKYVENAHRALGL